MCFQKSAEALSCDLSNCQAVIYERPLCMAQLCCEQTHYNCLWITFRAQAVQEMEMWLGGLLVERRTSVSQIRGSIPGQVAAV